MNSRICRQAPAAVSYYRFPTNDCCRDFQRPIRVPCDLSSCAAGRRPYAVIAVAESADNEFKRRVYALVLIWYLRSIRTATPIDAQTSVYGRQRWNRFDPVTRPGHRVSVLWIERLFRRRCATGECLLPKVSGICSTHTDHENFQHNRKFIKYWIWAVNKTTWKYRAQEEEEEEEFIFRTKTKHKNE